VTIKIAVEIFKNLLIGIGSAFLAMIVIPMIALVSFFMAILKMLGIADRPAKQPDRRNSN
jgi:hypothetical protein